jgi:hypothetical protein
MFEGMVWIILWRNIDVYESYDKRIYYHEKKKLLWLKNKNAASKRIVWLLFSVNIYVK